jgi:hypothetical protein
MFHLALAQEDCHALRRNRSVGIRASLWVLGIATSRIGGSTTLGAAFFMSRVRREKTMASAVPSGVITVRLKADALNIYRKHCPKGPKLGGAFLSRLLFEHEAREEQQEQLRQAQCKVCGGGGKS